jgi:hypothetical protein
VSEELLANLYPVAPGTYVPEESDDWMPARLGRITASDRVGRIMTDIGANAVLDEIVHELHTGEPFRKFEGNWATKHGNAHEDAAISQYDMVRLGDEPITRKPGFTVSPFSQILGASPDFLLGDYGVGQVKCPAMTKNHIALMYGGPGKYMSQIQCEALVTGRPGIVFISYDPRMPSAQQLHHEVVPVDETWQSMIIERVLLLEEMLRTDRRFPVGKVRVEDGVPSLF